MKIAVSGASGLIGSALVPTLRDAGHVVVQLVRRKPEGPNELEWDPAAGTIDAAGLAGIDGLVTLSGATVGRRWTPARKREILESRISSTSLLAQTVAELEPRPSVFVSAGGIGIYGDRGDEILTEESALGSGFLAEVGTAWEAAAEPARAAGIRVVNFRQGLVLSGEGGALGRMLKPFKLGLGGQIGSGRQWWSWVSMDDLLSAYTLALEGDLAGPVNLASPNPATNRQFVKSLGRVLHRPALFHVPEFAVKAIFGEMGETVLLASQRMLPARLLAAGFTFTYPDLDPALERALSA